MTPTATSERLSAETKPTPRLWHEDAPRPAQPTARSTKDRRAFHVLCWMLALLGAIIGMLSWLSPVPRPVFAPLWVVNYRSRLMPVADEEHEDRQALRTGGYFQRTVRNAYASQDRTFLVRDLAVLRELPARETVVLYLGAFAATDVDGGVVIYPGDVNPDVPASRLPLNAALVALRDCPARAKLLVLDIMQPLAELGEPGIPPGRLGVLVDDVADRVDAELERVPDPRRRVLCACSPGQVTLPSQILNRTVFGYFLEDGLRGWADVFSSPSQRDGRISVVDLADYLHLRVERWTWRNLAARQTPRLLGDGPDFSLVALDHGTPRPRLEATPPGAYPPWLAADWKVLDEARSDGSYRLAPRQFRQVEATIVRAEQRWRGAYPAAEDRQDPRNVIDRFQAQVAVVRQATQVADPRSVTLAEAQGKRPDPAVLAALNQMLLDMRTQTQGQPAEKAAPIRAKLVEEFNAKHKKKPYIHLASAVFAALAAEPRLDPATVMVLDGILRAHRPQAHYVESLFLRRLAALAQQPGDWPAETVQRAVAVAVQAERAASRSASIAWVGSLLTEAAQLHYNADYLLFSPGYAPPTAADELYRQAADRYAAILAYQERIEHAQRIQDEAMDFLPAYLPYLEKKPYHEKAWQDAVTGTAALNAALRPPSALPSGDAVGMQVAALHQQAEQVEDRIGNLRRPFTPESVTRLIDQSRRPAAGPAVVVEIDALLTTPFLRVEDRTTVWKAGQDLALRLHQETVATDREEDSVRVHAPPPDTDREYLEHTQQEQAARRARMALALFELGGLRAEDRQALEAALRRTAERQHDPGAAAALGELFRVTWVDRLPAQLLKEPDVYARDRLAWVIPPFDYSPLLDVPATNPRLQLLTAEAHELWAWLAGHYLYESQDQTATAFYYEAAVEYSRAATRPLPSIPHVQITGGPTPRLDPSEPVGSALLQVRFAATQNDTTAQLRVLTPDDSWLKITPALAGLSGGPWPLSPSANGTGDQSIAFQVALRSDAERSGTPPPRGFLVVIELAGRTFHYLVPVTVRQTPRRPELILSADPASPTQALGDLRLRATGIPQAYYLYVHNPTDKVQELLVDLSAGGQPGGTKLMLLAKSTQRVYFPPLLPPAPVPGAAAPAAPLGPAGLPELTGPLEIRLRDAADPSKVLDARQIRVDIAPPREYVRVASVTFAPPTVNEPNRLAVGLQARRPLAGPPCNVQLVLPPSRIPGFLGVQDGTFSGVLPPAGAELRLFAAGLRFLEGTSDNGFVYVNVDTYTRAFIFRTTFARVGDPTTPEEDTRPALRIQADPVAPSDPKFSVTLEVDNAPTGATLELTLGRMQGGSFVADRVRKMPRARRDRIGFQPAGPGGALLFDATVHDWTVTIDTSEVVGPRQLRARLLGADGAVLLEATRDVILADRAPGDVQFVDAPVRALRGAPLPLQAIGFDSGTKVDKVLFFVGRPLDGKVPPNTPTTAGAPVNGNRAAWGATLPIPATQLGPTDVSVQFVNTAGLSAFATTTVEVLDKLPPVFGTIRGTVLEGPRPQPDLDVILRDEKGQPVKDEKGADRRAKTAADGSFVFENVPPGNYKVFVSKQSSGRKAEKAVSVQAGKTEIVMLTLFL